MLEDKLTHKANQSDDTVESSLPIKDEENVSLKSEKQMPLLQSEVKFLEADKHEEVQYGPKSKTCFSSLKRAKSLDVLIKKTNQPKKTRHSVPSHFMSQENIIIDDDDDEPVVQINPKEEALMKLMEEECINMMEKGYEVTVLPKPECSKIGWGRMNQMKKTVPKSERKRKLKVKTCKSTAAQLKSRVGKQEENQVSSTQNETDRSNKENVSANEDSLVDPSPQYEEIDEIEKLEYDSIIHNLAAKKNQSKLHPEEFHRLFMKGAQKLVEATETSSNLNYESSILDYVNQYENIMSVNSSYRSSKSAKLVTVLNVIAPFIRKLRDIIDDTDETQEKNDLMINKATQTVQSNTSVEIQTDVISPPHGFHISSNDDFNSLIKDISIQTFDFSKESIPEIALEKEIVNKRERSSMDYKEEEEIATKKFKLCSIEDNLTVEFESLAANEEIISGVEVCFVNSLLPL